MMAQVLVHKVALSYKDVMLKMARKHDEKFKEKVEQQGCFSQT
jgi:hypothetical protein